MLAWDRVVSLHHPVLLKSINYALTRFNISADVPLQLSLGKRPVKDLPFRLVWNDTDTVAWLAPCTIVQDRRPTLPLRSVSKPPCQQERGGSNMASQTAIRRYVRFAI